MISSRIRARAPGKLVLIGEYAVLEGAPALAMAVDRFARVELSDQPDWTVLGPAAENPKTPLIQAVLAAFASPAIGGTVDTREFYDRTGRKLGLGSSAAATVALAGALADRSVNALDGETGWALLTKAHRQFQGGRGSGIDLACSLAGGVIRFELGEEPPMRSLDWPEPLQTCAVYVGRPASTSAFLERWTAWRSAKPEEAASLMSRLSDCSRAGVAAFAAADVAGFLDALEHYERNLRELGNRMDMSVVSPVHDAVRRVAARLDLVYKPSGAGGGDVGMAFSHGRADWAAFRAAVGAIPGCEPLDLKLARDGLLVESEHER